MLSSAGGARRRRVAPNARRGTTLLELLVALVAGAIVVAAVARLYVAQERAARTLLAGAREEARMSEAASILPVTVRAVAPGEGDIPSGMATDTALELRETIASGIVCAVGPTSITLPDDSDDDATLGAYLALPEVSDTIWLLGAADSGGARRWIGVGLADAAADRCGAVGTLAGGGAALRLTTTADPRVAGAATGSPARITRRARFSLYRAADGAWWLGYRAWSAVSGRLATVQPASGPYAPPSIAGAPFRYFDSAGVELRAPVLATERIARIDVRLRPARGAGEGASRADTRRDSLSTSIALRNR